MGGKDGRPLPRRGRPPGAGRLTRAGLAGAAALVAAVLAVTPLNAQDAAPRLEPAGARAPGQLAFEGMEPIAPGVDHLRYRWSGRAGVSAVHVLRVDLSEPTVALRALSPGQGTSVLALAPVTAQAAAYHEGGLVPVGAVNGDFWGGPPLGGFPYNLQIRRNELISSPGAMGAAIGFTAEKTPLVDVVRMAAWVAGPLGERHAITRVNKPVPPDGMALFTRAWAPTTRTLAPATEVVLADLAPALPLRAGAEYRATVRSVRRGVVDTPIPEGGLVLAGSGSAGAWLATSVRAGARITLGIDLQGASGRPWTDVAEAIGGGPSFLLRGGEVPPETMAAAGIHPRTAAGVHGRTLWLVTVDGRRPPDSTGVTLLELATILRSLGATDAVNLDGGGSTTFAARRPGEAGLAVLNRPSDGYERAVGNALAVFTSATPTGRLARLFAQPPDVLLLPGGRQRVSLSATDERLFPMPVPAGGVQWSIEPGGEKVAAIDGTGTLTALAPGRAVAIARPAPLLGEPSVQAMVPVEVTETVDEVRIVPGALAVEPQGSASFTVQALSNGRLAAVDPQAVRCSVEGVDAWVDGAWTIQAAQAPGDGWLRCSVAGARAEAVVTVGKPPAVLSEFESLDGVVAAAVRAVAEVNLAQRPSPVRSGTYALALRYDFTGSAAGTRAAYAVWPQGLALEGRPERLGLWVYGDGRRHWLRATLYDAARPSGLGVPIDLTPAGGIDWVGWRHVEAAVPGDMQPPVVLGRIYVAETDSSRADAGVIYLDRLRAIYSGAAEDVQGPELELVHPAPGAALPHGTRAIRVRIRDGGVGVDPSSIVAAVDGQPVHVDYDPRRQEATLELDQPLSPGVHVVVVDALDKAGNPPALPLSAALLVRET